MNPSWTIPARGSKLKLIIDGGKGRFTLFHFFHLFRNFKNWNYSIIRMRSRKPLPDIVQGPRILIFVKFYCVRVWKKNTLRLSSSFVSYNNGSDRRVTRCVKRTCLKVPLRRPMNGRRYRIQRTPTFRFEWKGPAMYIVRYEVCRENVPRDVASPNRTYRGDDFVSSTTVLLLSFLTNRCQRTEGNFIYSRGEKSYLLSIVLRSTSRLE